MRHKGLKLAGALLFAGAITISHGVYMQKYPLIEKHISIHPEQAGLDEIIYDSATHRSGQILLGILLITGSLIVGGLSSSKIDREH